MQNLSQGHCVQATLNTSFLSLAADYSASTLRLFWLQSQLLNLANKQDVYSLLLEENSESSKLEINSNEVKIRSQIKNKPFLNYE